MRVLVVNDDRQTKTQIVHVLKKLDLAVDQVRTSEQATDAVEADDYDAAIVDLESVSNTEDQAQLIRQILAVRQNARIMVVGSSNSQSKIISLLDQGVDEFVFKPINLDEFNIRINTLLSAPRDRESLVLQCGPLRFDMASRDVSLNGVTVELTPRERSVLQILLRQKGRVVSKEQIASRVFALDDEADPSAIEIYVHRLRRKTDHPDIEIKTVRGSGYVLRERTA